MSNNDYKLPTSPLRQTHCGSYNSAQVQDTAMSLPVRCPSIKSIHEHHLIYKDEVITSKHNLIIAYTMSTLPAVVLLCCMCCDSAKVRLFLGLKPTMQHLKYYKVCPA